MQQLRSSNAFCVALIPFINSTFNIITSVIRHNKQNSLYNIEYFVRYCYTMYCNRYNATILAYGQTGSGKTYTMGSGFDVELSQERIGIIPRAIEHLFNGIQERIEKAQESGTLVPEFKVMAQFMELYNEDIIDLFNPVYNKV